MDAVTVDTGRTASELRVVLGQLMRLLRSEHSLPLSHATVLARLERGDAATASSLAAAERVRPQSMAQTIAELEAEGLVTRRPDPSDGRRALIELAPPGRAALDDDRRRREGWLSEAIAGHLSVDEQAVLAEAVALLGRLVELRAPGRIGSDS
jgi:DNA-binding MarR family transcriptional regulator